MFSIDPRLLNDGVELINLNLGRLLLVNNSLFPWVILVPRRNGAAEIIDLNEADQQLLMKEISLVSKVMKKVFSPDKLNVAALGNVVPQLHVHIIARYHGDPAWPEPVFGKGKEAYIVEMQQSIANQLIGAMQEAIEWNREFQL